MTTIANDVIRKTPNVMGGKACIRRTRISVWNLVEWQRLGRNDMQLLAMYPTLTQDDLNAAWDYAGRHAEEIDAAILENNQA